MKAVIITENQLKRLKHKLIYERIFQPDFDDRGFDNVRGTADDVVMPESVKPKKLLKEYLEGHGVDLDNYLRDCEDIYGVISWFENNNQQYRKRIFNTIETT